ncbi:MAG TPA: DUF983 domain-containing protein [Hyphomonadaceae bacterium]|nr:DUF983 domain-containing protein [Hyphomonadaceae bacterium]
MHPSSEVISPETSGIEPNHAEPKRDVWLSVKRGLRLTCPSCGRGRLFAGYLRQAEGCPYCGLRTGDIRADDGPAWATILLVGHLVSPVFFVFASRDVSWLPLVAVLTLVVGMSLLLLPRMKGLFVGFIWASRAGEAEPG